MLEANTMPDTATILPDLTPAPVLATVNSKALWEQMFVVTKGAQWSALAISVLLLAKGNKAKNIRDRLKKNGISWGSKVVTMATDIANGACLDLELILDMETELAIAATNKAIEAHAAALKVKNFDLYYHVCGEAVYSDKVKRILERVKDNKAKAKATASETETEEEEEGNPTPAPVTTPIAPISTLEAIKNGVATLSADDLLAFEAWFNGFITMASQDDDVKAAA